MNLHGDIVIIDDDHDDIDVYKMALTELGFLERGRFFYDAATGLDYLKGENTSAFIVIMDINMPDVNGFQLRDQIVEDAGLEAKAIPLIFFSTSAIESTVIKAYKSTLQGYFEKPNDYVELKNILKIVIDYWANAKMPSNFL